MLTREVHSARFLAAAAFCLGLAWSSGTAAPPAVDSLADETLAYVGTYTGANSQGIYLFRLQTENLEVSQNVLLVPLGLAVETPSPSFLEIDAERRLVFAVNETNRFDGKPTGAVSAFSIESDSGKLTLLNQRSSMGAGPCHLVLDKTGRHLIVANYGSGSVAVLPVADDGQLGDASDFVQHVGKSVHPQRQGGPHAHCVTMSPDNRFAFVCDLGMDQIVAYRFDAERGKLTPNDPPFTRATPGAGPRHMDFGRDGRFAYVINELNSTITTFAYDAQAGALTERQTVSTLPAHFSGQNSTAEIAVHPNGRFLYASNRGRDSVTLFTIDPEEGTLAFVEEQHTGGRTPRHFGIHPEGNYLAVANQGSNKLLLCRIDEENGRLSPSAVLAEAPTPACIKFLPPRPRQPNR